MGIAYPLPDRPALQEAYAPLRDRFRVSWENRTLFVRKVADTLLKAGANDDTVSGYLLGVHLGLVTRSYATSGPDYITPEKLPGVLTDLRTRFGAATANVAAGYQALPNGAPGEQDLTAATPEVQTCALAFLSHYIGNALDDIINPPCDTDNTVFDFRNLDYLCDKGDAALRVCAGVNAFIEDALRKSIDRARTDTASVSRETGRKEFTYD